MKRVKNYLSLVKFSHTIFAMPFALIGYFLGMRVLNPNSYQILTLSLVILCMVFARSAAMAFNRYLDRTFDEKNPRTAIREIPRGIISANSALIFTIVFCVLFLVTCFFINEICFYLAPVVIMVSISNW